MQQKKSELLDFFFVFFHLFVELFLKCRHKTYFNWNTCWWFVMLLLLLLLPLLLLIVFYWNVKRDLFFFFHIFICVPRLPIVVDADVVSFVFFGFLLLSRLLCTVASNCMDNVAARSYYVITQFTMNNV